MVKQITYKFLFYETNTETCEEFDQSSTAKDDYILTIVETRSKTNITCYLFLQDKNKIVKSPSFS